MTRRTTDAGSRYVATLPFAREIGQDERADIERALETATFEEIGNYGPEQVQTRSVDVTADRARVAVDLPLDGDHTPADVLGSLYRALGEHHQRAGPVGQPTRAGGEQSIATADATALSLDRDPEDSEIHTYILAYPERRLTDEETAVLDHVTADAAVVEPTFLALVDDVSTVDQRPVAGPLRSLRENLKGHFQSDHGLRQRMFFERCEVGTLACADDQAREALRGRGERETHLATDSDESASEVSP